MPPSPLRIGFIGLGRIFSLHLAGYAGDPRVDLVAGFDPDPAAREAAGRLVPGLRLHDDLDRFLTEGLDLIEVLSPHPLHAQHTIAALRAGAHVSVQKPMAIDLAQADAMIAAARETGRQLRVFENYRFYQPLQRMKRLLDEGAIGRPLALHMRTLAGNPARAWTVSDATWRWRAALFAQTGLGRLTFDDGHHRIATGLWLLGPAGDVLARIGSTMSPNGPVDAPSTIIWRHADTGVHASWDVVYAPELTIRTRYYALDERFEITGTKGILKLNRATGHMLDEPVLTLYRDGRLEAFTDLDDDWGSSFAACTRAFVDAIAQGGQACLSAEEGREALALGLAIRDAGLRSGPARA